MDITTNLVKKIISWVIIFAFVGYLFFFFYQNPDQLLRLWGLSFGQIFLLTLLSVFAFIGLAYQLLTILKPYSKDLALYESFQLSLSNNLLNYFPLKSGAVVKGLYLKTVHSLRLQDYVLAMALGQLVWIIISAGLGILVGSFLVMTTLNEFRLSFSFILLILFAVVIICYSLLFFSSYLYKFLPVVKLRSYLQQYSKGVQFWLEHKEMLRIYSLVCLLLFIVFTIRLWFSFQIVGQGISLYEAVFIQCCIAVGFAFSLVPGNVGLKEGLIVGLAIIFGIEGETAVLAALIDRAASLLPTLVLGPIFLQRLSAKALSQESAGYS